MNIEINSCKVFFTITGGNLVFFTFFVLVRSLLTWNQKKMQISKNNTFRIFQNNPIKVILNFCFLVSSASILKKPLVLAFFMVFACLLLASSVQRWIRVFQKCSSLNQLWPDMSKLKSTGSALNIAENAKVSESALNMTEYLWEFNPGNSKCVKKFPKTDWKTRR